MHILSNTLNTHTYIHMHIQTSQSKSNLKKQGEEVSQGVQVSACLDLNIYTE